MQRYIHVHTRPKVAVDDVASFSFAAKMFLKKLENVTRNKQGHLVCDGHTSIGSLREGEEVGRLTGTDVVLLQLGKDVFSVGILPESANMGSYFIHQYFPLRRL